LNHKKSLSNFLIIGALLAMLSVALGAVGAHLLKNVLDSRALSIFQTACNYQMYHALAMILTALSLPYSQNHQLLNVAGWLFFAGIILFSGSLFGLSLLGIKSFAMITPIGGLCFILAWLIYSASFVKNKNNK
jgi:uncharacterized membrane protein YgdD (TMEM256/DUF423 family)